MSEPTKQFPEFGAQSVADGFWEVYHDDDCGEAFDWFGGGKCLKCGFRPDMQSIAGRKTVKLPSEPTIPAGQPVTVDKFFLEVYDRTFMPVTCRGIYRFAEAYAAHVTAERDRELQQARAILSELRDELRMTNKLKDAALEHSDLAKTALSEARRINEDFANWLLRVENGEFDSEQLKAAETSLSEAREELTRLRDALTEILTDIDQTNGGKGANLPFTLHIRTIVVAALHPEKP